MSLFARTAPHLPPRIERWAVQLLPYQFTVIKRPGAGNPADFLSRHPHTEPRAETEEEESEEEIARLITEAACPKALTVADIQQATEKDDGLQKVEAAISNNTWCLFLEEANQWHPEEKSRLTEIWRMREESSSLAGVIMRGRQIVVPSELESRMVALVHEGHQGVERTKARMRGKV